MLRRGCLTPICHAAIRVQLIPAGRTPVCLHDLRYRDRGQRHLSPAAGWVFSFGLLTLDLGGGGATPLGVFGIAINSSAGNGSAEAYYGDLEFQLTRTSGLSTDDFITNAAIDPGSAGPA